MAAETAPRSQAERCYRFRSFELRLAERQLLHNGTPTGLGGRTFDVLTHLIRRAGHLVSKDELLEAVWQRSVVEENNLQKQISTLRKVIGRDAIATVSGCGYQFVAPLLPTAASTELPPREPVTPEVLRKYILLALELAARFRSSAGTADMPIILPPRAEESLRVFSGGLG